MLLLGTSAVFKEKKVKYWYLGITSLNKPINKMCEFKIACIIQVSKSWKMPVFTFRHMI